jgi:hypothetical protein
MTTPSSRATSAGSCRDRAVVGAEARARKTCPPAASKVAAVDVAEDLDVLVADSVEVVTTAARDAG